MNDPAPFRLSLPQARALKFGVGACVLLAGALYLVGVVYALASGDAGQAADASLDGSILFALLGLGLYVRRALGLSHRRQISALAWLTDPHTPVDPGRGERDAEIPSPRPSVDPEPSREEDE